VTVAISVTIRPQFAISDA